MKASFSKTVVINVYFNDEEFEFLDKCIKNSEYKHLSECGAGNWWYGYSNFREYDTEEKGREFDFRHLDILLKCLEPFICFDFDNTLRKVLRASLFVILESANTYHEMNQDPINVIL